MKAKHGYHFELTGVGNNLLRSISNNDVLDGKSGLDSAILPGTAGEKSIRKVGELITTDSVGGLSISPRATPC